MTTYEICVGGLKMCEEKEEVQYQADDFDVVVIGAGHAGCEAALASARMGMKTLILTINLDMIGFMPCNPSIGGPAKGIVVREIDALGGEMGRNIDKTYIQMRMLNTGKGPAVRALRAQADKSLYQIQMKQTLENQENLTVEQGMAEKVILENGVVKGVKTEHGAVFGAKKVVIATGTYLKGKVIVGPVSFESGPNHQQASVKFSDFLQEAGVELVRFKTGTPPRVDGKTIDYDRTEIQPGDENPKFFSFTEKAREIEQIPCWLTYTSEETHRIIHENLHRSPMYSGVIEGTGPRYCPSVEDKIVRFSDKSRHQIFLEPEGQNTREVYIQGLSTSMPEDVQRQMVRSVPGLENVKFMRAGYAIEYNCINPTQLWPSLEFKNIPGLYCAGQMNGTSGYEEAAGQGLIAGINAALAVQGKDPLILDRSEAYIGVLIDDLVTKGTNEPYRLLTSRAEYRLLLRHDNADLRLTRKGYEIGLVSEKQFNQFSIKEQTIEKEKERLKGIHIQPTKEVNEWVTALGGTPIKDGFKAYQFLKRTEITYDALIEQGYGVANLSDEVKEQVELQIKYEGYIEKALQQVERMKKMNEKKIPKWLDYDNIRGIANEAKQKLKKIQPLNVGQASRISGVNPADISILLVYIEQGKK